MKREILIAPSILSADFSRLGAQVKEIADAGADMIHLDVMDGNFVPNITFGPPIVKSIRPFTSLPFDAHLMIEKPERFIDDFKNAGVDILTVQAEACIHLERVLCQIREAGMKSGVAVNPATPLDFLPLVLHAADLVLIMTVNPGFGGQKMIEPVLPKIRQAREMLDRHPQRIFLEVDGGVNQMTAGKVIEAGADLLVAGSAVFGASDYRKAIDAIRGGSLSHE